MTDRFTRDIDQDDDFGDGRSRSAGAEPDHEALYASDETAARRAAKRAAMKSIVVGLLLFVVGLAISIGTYMLANDEDGGRYMVTWGLVIWGGIQTIKGLIAYRGASA